MDNSMAIKALASMALAAALTGCYTELGAEPECFADGQQVAAFETEVCCDPEGVEDDGNRLCIDFFEAQGNPVAELAACVPDNRSRGVCLLDCRLGENCECASNRDCSGGALCVAGSGATCQAAGFAAGIERCGFCARCTEDADCAGDPAGERCESGVCVQ